MSQHLALTVARLHGVLAVRRHSDVFHIYVGTTTPGGRTTRSARPVCNAHTRPLTILRRCGVTVDTHGRRMCARCSARLSAIAHRAEQPPLNLDAEKTFWQATGIDSPDLVVALAVASTVEETHAIARVTNLLKGPVHTTVTPRPEAAGKEQARWDFEQQLLKRRRELRAAELTPEQRETAAVKRDVATAREQQIAAARQKQDRLNRALARRLNGQYLMPHQKQLLDSA